MVTQMKTLPEITDIIRSFFHDHSFEEVFTPVLIPAPVPEQHIEFFRVGNAFMRPSPEIEMKIMLAEGKKKIFQIGPCFRKGENGRIHKEEFTMLEWYEAEADYMNLIDFTKEMLLNLSENINGTTSFVYQGRTIKLDSDWLIITVDEAFAKFAETTPEEALERGVFDQLLVEKVEPAIALSGVPVILKDYPAELAALAKLKKENQKVAERWELYIAGIELANTYTELTDCQENKKRFAKFAEERKLNRLSAIPVNDKFFTALEKGMPESSGCALGVDRLAMIFNDTKSI
jgi:lysyl-tRNA synthetase class 2